MLIKQNASYILDTEKLELEIKALKSILQAKEHELLASTYTPESEIIT